MNTWAGSGRISFRWLSVPCPVQAAASLTDFLLRNATAASLHPISDSSVVMKETKSASTGLIDAARSCSCGQSQMMVLVMSRHLWLHQSDS